MKIITPTCIALAACAFVLVSSSKKRPPSSHQISSFTPHLMIQFESVGFCEEPAKVIPLEEVKINWISSSVTSFSMRYEALEDLGNLTQAIYHFYKCASSALSSCEKFHTWRFGKETCALINLKNQFWSRSLSAIRPTTKCPFHKGKYTVVNATFDASLLQRLFPFPLEKTYWRTRAKIYNSDLWMCMNFSFQVFRVRY